MLKSPRALLLISLTFLITLGLAIGLQGVLGINIGNVLNLGGNKITNLGTPTVAGDAATKGFVDSAIVARVLYGNCAHRYLSFVLPTCFARSPAVCVPATTFGDTCQCPAGYEEVITGWLLDASNSTVYSSCYKL